MNSSVTLRSSVRLWGVAWGWGVAIELVAGGDEDIGWIGWCEMEWVVFAVEGVTLR